MSASYRKPLVVVTVGGDHHPFDRLMGWVENWLAAHGSHAHCVVQHGTSRPPVGAISRPYIDHDELLGLMTEARAVVSSGGPATLSEARALGHLPIAVPRLAALGEVVDDHQRAFTHRLHELGLVVMVEDENDFSKALDRGVDAPRLVPAQRSEVSPSVARVGELIDTLYRSRDHRRRTENGDSPLARR